MATKTCASGCGRVWAGLVFAVIGPACSAAHDDPFVDAHDSDGQSEGGDREPRVVEPNPVPAEELLGVVRVSSSVGACSGVLIADDTVLTTAGCLCADDLLGGDVCVGTVTVTFRDDPGTAGTSLPSRSGTVMVHPGHRLSWATHQLENDLAIITLGRSAPSYVDPLDVATTNLPAGSTVQVVGFGKIGGSCRAATRTPNFDVVTIDGYEDGGKIMRLDDPAVCEGDSGGAVLNLAGTKIYGVHSARHWTFSRGWESRSVAGGPYRGWIKEQTCSSSFRSACDGKGPICQCGEGGADCDFDSDCKGALVCTHDVGAELGLRSTADVCLEPRPRVAPRGPVGSSEAAAGPGVAIVD